MHRTTPYHTNLKEGDPRQTNKLQLTNSKALPNQDI